MFEFYALKVLQITVSTHGLIGCLKVSRFAARTVGCLRLVDVCSSKRPRGRSPEKQCFF
jgi:hypothetical protein